MLILVKIDWPYGKNAKNHTMSNKIMTIDAVFDKYTEIAQNASFNDNPATKNDTGLRSVWSDLLKKNRDAYLLDKTAISLFNLILADRRISRLAQQDLIARVYMAMAYSSDNRSFNGLPHPVSVDARSLQKGMVFVWCDTLHVYAGSGLAAEIDDNLSTVRLLFNFNEADDQISPLIFHIGNVDADTIENIDSW